MKYGVEEHFKNYGDSDLPLFFPPDSDELCRNLGRRAAFALFVEVCESLMEWDGLVTTLQLVRLPEYAFIGDKNLRVYNKFLLTLSERGLLPIRQVNGDIYHPTDDWLWSIDDEIDEQGSTAKITKSSATVVDVNQ